MVSLTAFYAWIAHQEIASTIAIVTEAKRKKGISPKNNFRGEKEKFKVLVYLALYTTTVGITS